MFKTRKTKRRQEAIRDNEHKSKKDPKRKQQHLM